MDSKKITFVYIVGGGDEHYSNLKTSIDSITDLLGETNFLVLDLNNKFPSDYPNVKILESTDNLDLSQKKVGFQFWRQKYVAVLEAQTEYVVYVDTDTALANDRFDELFSEIGEGVGAAKHFYVPTLRDFFEKAVPSENKKFFHELFLTFEADINSNFYAGGVFLYKNSDKNRELISKVLESYDSVYKDSDGNYKEYIQGVTDEVFLSAIAEKEIIDLGGRLNHCSMGPKHMELEITNGTLKGKNPFEEEMKDVIFLHADPHRRDPSKHYEEPTKTKIKELFRL